MSKTLADSLVDQIRDKNKPLVEQMKRSLTGTNLQAFRVLRAIRTWWQGVVVNVRFVREEARVMGIDGHVCELQLVLLDHPFETVSRNLNRGPGRGGARK
jgi:hypothetical protein